MKLFKKTSDNVYLIFMSVESKLFLGYAKLNSEIKPIS